MTLLPHMFFAAKHEYRTCWAVFVIWADVIQADVIQADVILLVSKTKTSQKTG